MNHHFSIFFFYYISSIYNSRWGKEKKIGNTPQKCLFLCSERNHFPLRFSCAVEWSNTKCENCLKMRQNSLRRRAQIRHAILSQKFSERNLIERVVQFSMKLNQSLQSLELYRTYKLFWNFSKLHWCCWKVYGWQRYRTYFCISAFKPLNKISCTSKISDTKIFPKILKKSKTLKW